MSLPLRIPPGVGRWIVWLGLLLLTFPGLAQANPVPFQARYALSLDGWPDARIHHRLSQRGDTWESEMHAAVAIAEGTERSRFRLNNTGIQPLQFMSSYRMLGLGKRYSLSADDMDPLIDRQAALFALSRQVRTAPCTHSQVSPCSIHYLDHKGNEETLHYRVVSRGDITLEAGTFPGIRIDAWEPGEKDRHLFMTFHTEVPGLLLGMEYRRDGEVSSYLTLTKLDLAGQANQGR